MKKFEKYRSLLLLLLAIVALTSCAGIRTKIPFLNQSKTKQEKPVAATQPSTGESPLEIQVENAFLKEETLHVKVLLKGKTEFETDKVAISLVGLSDGKVITEQTKLLSEVVSTKQINEAQTVAIFFDLPAERLSEYQVRASWGNDAQEIIALHTERVESKGEVSSQEKQELPLASSSTGRKVILKDVNIVEEPVSCKQPPCDIYYTVHAVISNNTQQVAHNVEFALGLIWENSGQSVPGREDLLPLDKNEEAISLGEVVLTPGLARQVRVRVDRAVPVIPGGRFVPKVRLLSYLLDDLPQ